MRRGIDVRLPFLNLAFQATLMFKVQGHLNTVPGVQLMSSSIRDAAALLASAHQRAAQRKAELGKRTAGCAMVARIGVIAMVLVGLVAGVNAVMMAVLH
jgi:hypothetical protein